MRIALVLTTGILMIGRKTLDGLDYMWQAFRKTEQHLTARWKKITYKYNFSITDKYDTYLQNNWGILSFSFVM